ncbi:RNA-binding region-containing protein 3 [Manduca sexta]|uniref:RNA-binding region-containing protein 3 n=1 Tax=Manduca sexta TaxID=7130 RepID=UPI00188F4EA5|nr:RNA-binding region-containing protein 3 [Manduca sexta]
MSKVLMIRNLPTGLSLHDKEQLLKHFGAELVWESRLRRHYVFASFATVEKAKASMSRLHQLEIGNKRLVVEFSFANETIPQKEGATQEVFSSTTKLIKEFLKHVNAWNPSIDFYQPPPPYLKYKYPEISPIAAINIVYTLLNHKPFYIQALHLMNKMSLDVPFKENQNSLAFFKETFKPFFVDVQAPMSAEETESEISSEETEKRQQTIPKLIKRKRKLPIPSRKLPGTVPSAPKITKTGASQEVFETVPQVGTCPKKISVVVTQDALQKPVQEPDVVGELGKFQKEETPIVETNKEEPETPTITKAILLKNRISYKDMKILPIFKNYHPGQPSMRLYIKNLAKSVTEADVKSIYRRYIEDLVEEEEIGFDVRVMQEGRMKGQAFVTFPSIEIAEVALNETNGYMLKEKPMVVQFARVANKKTTE